MIFPLPYTKGLHTYPIVGYSTTTYAIDASTIADNIDGTDGLAYVMDGSVIENPFGIDITLSIENIPTEPKPALWREIFGGVAGYFYVLFPKQLPNYGIPFQCRVYNGITPTYRLITLPAPTKDDIQFTRVTSFTYPVGGVDYELVKTKGNGTATEIVLASDWEFKTLG